MESSFYFAFFYAYFQHFWSEKYPFLIKGDLHEPHKLILFIKALLLVNYKVLKEEACGDYYKNIKFFN